MDTTDDFPPFLSPDWGLPTIVEIKPGYAITQGEMALIAWLINKGEHVTQVVKSSTIEYDVHLRGLDGTGRMNEYCTPLPLVFLWHMNWTSLAELSDHPEQVRRGEWSGVCTSSRESIIRMLRASLRCALPPCKNTKHRRMPMGVATAPRASCEAVASYERGHSGHSGVRPKKTEKAKIRPLTVDRGHRRRRKNIRKNKG
jgi:hypothetical protein